jgi:hypothetical protein
VENFANMAALDQAEQRAVQTTKDAKKTATDAAQKDLIKVLTKQVEMLAKQNREILAKLNFPPAIFATIPATGAPTTTARC